MNTIKTFIKFIKVLFLVIVLVLFTLILYKPTKNNNLNSSSNLNKLIDKANHIFILEKFDTSQGPTHDDVAEKLKEELEEELNEISTTVMPTAASPTEMEYPPKITDMIDQLKDLEGVCKTFETQRSAEQEDERIRLETLHRQQLDVETEKIEQLKDIVKYYKEEYDKKLTINNTCRQQQKKNLNGDINYIQENVDQLKRNEVILNLKK
jgi:hypothetical protein